MYVKRRKLKINEERKPNFWEIVMYEFHHYYIPCIYVRARVTTDDTLKKMKIIIIIIYS